MDKPNSRQWLHGRASSFRPEEKGDAHRSHWAVYYHRRSSDTGVESSLQGLVPITMKWRRRCLRPRVIGIALLSVGIILTLLAFHKTEVPYVKKVKPPLRELLYRALSFDDVTAARHQTDNLNVSQNLGCVDAEGVGKIQDVMCMKRPDYLTNYKNPCWVDWTVDLQRLRCLPYFHILGVDKCGTTDLHSRIAQHPRVLNNSGGLGKETYYWCWLKYGQWMRKGVTPKPFSYYLKLFQKPAVTIAENPDPQGFHPLITGDGTPMDFWDFRAWPLIPQNKGLKEPVVLTPHLMKHLYRDPKFIVIFRNPVERIYSDYIFLGYGFTPEKFRKDVPKAVNMMEKCMKVNTTRQCVFSNDTYVHLPMRIHLGMYSVFMKEWLAVFPRSSFYILRTEDYHDNMTYHLKKIFTFLGLDPLPEDALQDIVDADRKHETKIKKKVKDMFPDTRELLQSFYSGYNEELAVMLDDAGFLWSEQDASV